MSCHTKPWLGRPNHDSDLSTIVWMVLAIPWWSKTSYGYANRFNCRPRFDGLEISTMVRKTIGAYPWRNNMSYGFEPRCMVLNYWESFEHNSSYTMVEPNQLWLCRPFCNDLPCSMVKTSQQWCNETRAKLWVNKTYLWLLTRCQGFVLTHG